MVSNEITILMGAHGYLQPVGIPVRIPYYGGLDDVVGGISEHLPEIYKIHVLVHSCGDEKVIHKPKENVWVHGVPAEPFRAGDEFANVYKPLGRECDGFMAQALDSKLIALKEVVPEILKESKGELIAHMHDYFSGPLGVELKKNGIPFVFQSHLSADRQPIDPYYSNCHDLRLFYEKVSCEEADVVIAVSEDTKNSILNAYRGIPPEKIKVIENAIDTEKFRPPTEEERRRNDDYLASFGISESHRPFIYWKGRFVREKGADNLLRAFEVFSPNHQDYSLVLTGFSGEIYHELMGLRASMPEHIRNKIIVINQLVDVVPFDQNCDFAVYPSIVEAFGLMAVQSQACAKPVVAGNGGLRYNVKGGYTGVHINPYSPQAIAEGMEIAHQNKAEWGRNAREFVVQNYSWKTRIDDYDRLYERVLESS